MQLSYNTIAIFAGSENYGLEWEAQRLGHELGRRSVDLVCNGSGKGLAEEFFGAAKSEGAPILKLVSPDRAQPPCAFQPNLSIVAMECAAERKREMIQRGEAIFVLPGGLVAGDSDHVLTADDLVRGAGEKPLILIDLGKHFTKLHNALPSDAPQVFKARCIDEALDMFDHMRMHPKPAVSAP
jgi:predicted Rossmann-fold nucleotide-binding protein